MPLRERDFNSLVSGLRDPPTPLPPAGLWQVVPVTCCHMLKDQTGLGAVCSHPMKTEGARPECEPRSFSTKAHGPATSLKRGEGTENHLRPRALSVNKVGGKILFIDGTIFNLPHLPLSESLEILLES